LDVTLARIHAIVGEDNAGCAVLEDTHAEEGFRIEPFSLSSRNVNAFASSQQRSVLRHLRPPETIIITLQNAQPARFLFRERQYVVESAYGPWLTGGDWWNQALWGFEQWDLIARAEDGSRLCCCMVLDLMQNQWQMAAFYD
jgi:protein ImuB